jgi:hypothetical protein
MKVISERATVLGVALVPGLWIDHTVPIGTVPVLVLSAMGITIVARWGWGRWRRWRRITQRACPICRRHPDAEFVDCRKGDCVTGRIWQPGLPWPPRDAEDAYV